MPPEANSPAANPARAVPPAPAPPSARPQILFHPRTGALGFLTGPWFALIVFTLLVISSIDPGGRFSAATVAAGNWLAPERAGIGREFILACWYLLLTTCLAFNRLMTSVRCGVFLLFMLALAAIIGTLVESMHDTATAQQHVYHSWWMICLMILLAINLNAASWPFYINTIRLPRTRPLRRQPAGFATLKEKRDVVHLPAAIRPEDVRRLMESHVGWVTEESGEGGTALFAQRGIIQRWGYMITHLGITLLLGGGVVLSLRAHFEGPPAGAQLWVGEGLWRDWYWEPIPSTDRFRFAPMPFSVRLHDFDAEMFGETGVPRFFGSTLEIRDSEGHSETRDITMNEAGRWRGWKFSQNSYLILGEDLTEDDGQLLFSMDGGLFMHIANEGRLAIQLVDQTMRRVLPTFDVAPGARVNVPQSDFEFELTDATHFRVFEAGHRIADGALEYAARVDPPPTGEEFPENLRGVLWAVRVDGLFPDYIRTAEGDSSRSARLDNPAVRWTLLRDGLEVGNDLSFQHEGLRDQSFAELPIRARLLGHEPASLTNWIPGQPIALQVEFADAASGVAIATNTLGIGSVHLISSPTPSDAASVESAHTHVHTEGARFTATALGRMPAAYSVFTVMQESTSLKSFFYVSFFLFLGGPLLAFTKAHWQIWAWVAPDGRRVLLGGRARGRRTSLPKVLDRLAEKVSNAASAGKEPEHSA